MSCPYFLAEAFTPWPVILALGGVLLVVIVQLAIWARNYRRAGPNQVLIISGRQQRLPNGQTRGFRIVKGGGSFVVPLLERADTLSLEVLSVDWRVANVRLAQGSPAGVNCALQVKIGSDDQAIVAAAEHFLSKEPGEIKKIAGQIVEKHLRTVLGTLSPAELEQQREQCAAKVQAAAAPDLARMGLAIVGFSVQG
jgi:flotillin